MVLLSSLRFVIECYFVYIPNCLKKCRISKLFVAKQILVVIQFSYYKFILYVDTFSKVHRPLSKTENVPKIKEYVRVTFAYG